jgi:cyanoexosortase A
MPKNFYSSILEQDGGSRSVGLLGILAVAHMGLDLYMGLFSHLMISALFWVTVLLQIWDKRYDHPPQFRKGSFILSTLAVIGVLLFGFYRRNGNVVSFFPVVALFAWIIGVYGCSKIQFYRKELLMLLCLGLPKFTNDRILDIAPITAQAVFLILLYSGHTVVRQGLHIFLPQGSIKIVPECSGLVLIIYMLSVAIIFLSLFSLSRGKSVLLVFLAILTGFVANAIRVTILAILSKPDSVNSFKFWHGNHGASLFVLGAILSYALLSFLIIRLTPDRRLSY